MEIQRILHKFDSLMESKDFDEAERLLTYWIDECEANGDKRNRFTLLNELVGFYRMRGERVQGLKVSTVLLDTVADMNLSDKVSGATAFINVATAYKSFGMADRALQLYEKALIIYERELDNADGRLPALHNNMALALVDIAGNDINLTDKFEKASELYKKALSFLRNIEGSENEQAITYLNMADLAVIELGAEESEQIVEEYIGKAYELLEKSRRDSNPDFRMTMEKCIPVFRHYGYFMMANNLQETIL